MPAHDDEKKVQHPAAAAKKHGEKSDAAATPDPMGTPEVSPQPNPPSAPGGDKVGGEATTADGTGAPLSGDDDHHKVATPGKPDEPPKK